MRKVFLVFLLSLFIVGCSTVKYVPREKVPVIKELSAKKVFSKASKNRLKGDYFTIKKANVKLILDKDTDFSFKGQIKIVRDSIIYGSFQVALGIEALRFVITPDSVVVLNRIQKQYYSLPIDQLSSKLNVYIDYYDIQDILLGELFIYGPRKGKRRFFRKSDIIYDNGYHFSSSDFDTFSFDKKEDNDMSVYNQTFDIDGLFNTVKNSVQFSAYNRRFDIAYLPTDNPYFKYSELDLSVGDLVNQIILNMKIVSVNSERSTIRFSIPSIYKKVNL